MTPRRLPIAFSLLAATLIACLTQAALASDAWIVTDQDLVAENQPVWISLVAGDAFPFSTTPLTGDSITSCTDTAADLTMPLTGLKRQDGAMSRRQPVLGPGFHVFTASFAPEFVEHRGEPRATLPEPAQAMDAAEEADETVTSAAVVTEKRRRFAKTIVGVLPIADSDATSTEPVGQLLEVVPLSRPTEWRHGNLARVCVLLDGHAWPGIAVSARCTEWSDDTPALETRTDVHGFASFTMEDAGHWCITAQLTRAATSIGRADIETLCSTLSFRVAGDSDASRTMQIVRAATGTLDPQSLLGYRMGQCAIYSFGMPTNSRALAVTHQTPEDAPATGITQGIRLAVRPDGGDVSMWRETSPDQGMMTVFNHRLEDRQLVIQVLPSVLQWLREIPPEETELASLRLAAMPDDEIFAATLLEPHSPPHTPATVPWDDITETIAAGIRPNR